MVKVHVNITLLYLLGLTEIFEVYRVMTEELLEDVWMCELSTRSSQRTIGLLSNIDRVIDQCHLLVGLFVLEFVTILSPELCNFLNNFRSSIRDLDRIRLNMGYRE